MGCLVVKPLSPSSTPMPLPRHLAAPLVAPFAAALALLAACEDAAPRPGGESPDASDDGATGADASTDAAADPDGASSATFLDDCFDGIVPTASTQRLHVENWVTDDGLTRLRTGREHESCKIPLKATRYTLTRFAIEGPGGAECITDAKSLLYVVSQHNWFDRMEAEGERSYTVHLELADFGSGDMMYSLVVDDGGKQPLTLGAGYFDPATVVCD